MATDRDVTRDLNCLLKANPDKWPNVQGAPGSFIIALKYITFELQDATPGEPNVPYDLLLALGEAYLSGCMMQVPGSKLTGKCCRCDTINEYIGPEHLDSDGKYFCRSCKLNPYR